MFADYKEMVSHPGKVENEHVMVPFILDHAEWWDFSGDVDSPTGAFMRAGKWILVESSQGFVYGAKYGTVEQAVDIYNGMDHYYCEWANTVWQ